MESQGHLPWRQEKRSNHRSKWRLKTVRETSTLTDRLVWGGNCGFRSQTQILALPSTGWKPWEGLLMSQCLGSPICKTGSQPQTRSFITLGFVAKVGPANHIHFSFATGSLLGCANRGR